MSTPLRLTRLFAHCRNCEHEWSTPVGERPLWCPKCKASAIDLYGIVDLDSGHNVVFHEAPRSMDAFLSRRARKAWSNAYVYHQDGTRYVLEREQEEPLGLGNSFKEARHALEILLKSWAESKPIGTAERRVREASLWKEEPGAPEDG